MGTKNSKASRYNPLSKSSALLQKIISFWHLEENKCLLNKSSVMSDTSKSPEKVDERREVKKKRIRYLTK